MGLADAIGLGMYLAVSAVYLNVVVGISNHEIGVVLGVSGAASVLAALPLAVFAQWYGLRRSLIAYFAARGLCYLALACAVDLVTAFLAVGLVGLFSRGTGPLVQAATVAGADSAVAVQALARLRMLRNAGMAAGALPAGAAIAAAEEWAFRSVMVTCALMFLGCALLSKGLPRHGEIRQPVRGGAGVGRDSQFLFVTAMYGALVLSAILLGVGFPLWIVQRSNAPAWSAGFVHLANTVLVVTLQVRISTGSERPARARSMMMTGGLLAAVAAATMPLSAFGTSAQALAVLVIVVVVMTFAELYISAGSMGLALAHSPEDRRPVYLATYNLGFAVATVVGPPLVGLGLAAGNLGWFGWAVFFAVTGLLARTLPTQPRAVGSKGT
ncbi:hypothetical protein ALI144C_31495 [Actinosynnema sp. ALI-1.44]|nr:hypothetical protein ALI144C_31495 [Actinosynnema sp. ALI-1.44]